MSRPLLEYGKVIWYPRYSKDAESQERVQRSALQTIKELSVYSYEDILLLLVLPSLTVTISLVYRLYRGDAIEIYVMCTQLTAQVCFLLVLKQEPGVSHGFKLLKRHCRSQLRSHFLLLEYACAEFME